MVSVDSTVIRAHHHSAGARHLPPRDIPAEYSLPVVLEDYGRFRPTLGTVE